MNLNKKILSLICALAMIVPLLVPFGSVFARTVITNPSAVNGSHYTGNVNLAMALTAVFQGDIDLYSNSACTNEVFLPIGKSLSSSGYFIRNKTTGATVQGWQCFIYGNAVYNRLFNEFIRDGSNLRNSEVVISGGTNALSYAKFSAAGVRCGAYIRTTSNKNGSYNSAVGHCMIVLYYDQSNIHYLEGNADGKGLARITSRSWSEFNYTEFTKKGRYLCHVIQPTAAKYEEFYPNVPHDHTYELTEFEIAHPHKEYTRCICGATQYTGNTKTNPLCIDCFPPVSTNPDDYVFPSRTLKYNSAEMMKGTDVAWMQAVLYQMGYSIDVDGKFGSGTAEVVKSFQSAYGLTVDGICGSASCAKLLEWWEANRHVHSFTVSFDTDHPHKEYKTCACGITEYTGNAQTVESCAECYPVGTPTLSLSTEKAAVGSNVTVSWNQVENAKLYNVKCYDEEMEAVIPVTTASLSGKISFDQAGTYSITVEALGQCGDAKESDPITLTVYLPSGNSGECSWNTSGNTVTFSGNGAMGDYSKATPAPWNVIGIQSAIFESGITSIGENAFADCTELVSVTVPKTVTTVGKGAFSSCNALDEVWYIGTEADRQQMTVGTGNEALTNATWHYVDSTCDTECNKCGATREAKHVYDNTLDLVCNECGFERPPYTPGDLDGVEGVAISDAIYLLYHINFADDYSVNQPVDFDGNGDVEIADAIYLLYHVNFSEDYPLN